MSLLAAAAETTTEHGPHVNPWVVGIVVFSILLFLMLGLLSFGKGREHS
ncbi:MAG: hypothetical protein JWP10_60 [Nocardioidaceae bacterium]|nr:hypothetical protein [Nocardioidaceae bacterium]